MGGIGRDRKVTEEQSRIKRNIEVPIATQSKTHDLPTPNGRIKPTRNTASPSDRRDNDAGSA